MITTADLTASLQTHFGFSSFRPGQVEALQSMLNGQHTLVVMPTGAGKSLVFQLAALHHSDLTLVISPLVALMKDQVDSLVRRHIPATFINSAISGEEQNRRLRALADGAYRLVYIAPERLRSRPFLNIVQHQKVGLLAIDEAHCISEWGHDFRPDYLHIARFRRDLGSPLTVALTATATPQVQNDITRLLGVLQAQRIVTGFNRPNLSFEVRSISSLPARLNALQELLTPFHGEASIVYTGTRREAEEVADFLESGLQIRAQYYHAGLATEERNRIQDAFMSGPLSVVVATNAFGMGIDRPDVRQVVHFSLPGSLEAYYQEAGRAGRDGQLARVVLLYAPEDRALQEWFIENSISTADDLRLLYDALRPASERQQSISSGEISRLTGLQEVKIRIGLSELERAGMLERLGDEGLRLRVRLHGWKEQEIPNLVSRLRAHQAHRRAQLDKMISYAESNACRRQIILQHFGDQGPCEAEICCDNCQMRRASAATPGTNKALSSAEEIALMVLQAIQRLPRNLGASKIVQILRGSHAKGILKFNYQRHADYGKLADLSRDDLKEIITQLQEKGYLKLIGGMYPVLRLTPQGEAALQHKAPIPVKLSHQRSRLATVWNEVGDTMEQTAQLLAAGLSVRQVATRRGLMPSTIYEQAAQLIADGKLSVETVIPEDVRKQVEEAIRQVGSVEALSPLKAHLPEEIDYNLIRCVVAHWKRQNSQPEAGTAQGSAEAYLSRSHPRPLPGPWQAGWALGFHSGFAGADWKRSEMGDLAYRLKYQADLSTLPVLVDHTLSLIAEHPELSQVDAIVPVPPSQVRENDPVSCFAAALAERLSLPSFPVVFKARQTTPQKEMRTMAQKRANVAGAFALKTPVKGKRLLVIDDLFDSGATLEEIFSLLRRAGAARICVLTLTRTIHSDA